MNIVPTFMIRFELIEEKKKNNNNKKGGVRMILVFFAFFVKMSINSHIPTYQIPTVEKPELYNINPKHLF